MLIQSKERIVFFGDSLTSRTDLLCASSPAVRYSLDYRESYVDILMKKLLVHYPQLNIQFCNKGAGGDTAAHLLERYAKDVLPFHPTLVVLWIGQNDAKHFSPQKFQKAVRCLLGWMQEDHLRTVVLSTSAHRDANKMIALKEIDEILKQECAAFGFPFIDVKSPMLKIMEHNRKTACPIELFTTGSHLSELGNLLIADTVFDYFRFH